MPNGAIGEEHSARPSGDVRVIAFYLPQYHRISENDHWWGEGFTEWTNVRKARPNFVGHYQPHIPGELGYYDLSDPAVRKRQAALAREHGIYGFCYYHYWFNGKRLLERPFDAVLASGEPDLPFCVCWANENWTRRWDGHDQDVLIAQRYSFDDSRAFIHSLFAAFRDRRYIRIDGRPLLLVYKPVLIPDLAATIALWREECSRAGVGDPYVVGALTSTVRDPDKAGIDAAVEFPPHGHFAECINGQLSFTNARFAGAVFNFRSYVTQLMTQGAPPFKVFRTVLPGWDNTARRQDDGSTFVGSPPELFQYWLERVVQQTRLRFRGEERLVFVNAWNEWGEGCHLEPDQRFGRAHLEAVRNALAVPQPEIPARPLWRDMLADADHARMGARLARATSRSSASAPPRVSVVMPAYNHERFVVKALDSVVAQSVRDLEIVAVDDGSLDRTATLLDEYIARAPMAMTLVRQSNQGAFAAINHGLALARGEFVAILNSDDMFAPMRLERLLEAMRERRADFAFSGTLFIDDNGAELGAESIYVDELRERIERCAHLSNPLLALIRDNVSISSGNFVFRRALLEKTGGFAAFRVCHDWDFILAASYYTPLAFVPEPLYSYRVHRDNTFAGQRLLAQLEVDQLRAGFFAAIGSHPAMLDARLRRRLIEEIRRTGCAEFLPTALRIPDEVEL